MLPSWFLLITFCSAVRYGTAQVESRLRRWDIRDERAVCNDNSRALFYYDSNPNVSASKWIIYFEGGAGCSSKDECTARFRDLSNRPLMSSNMYQSLEEAEIVGKGLMSSDESENPTFYHFHHVYVPYCSSDVWLGRNYSPNVTLNDTGPIDFSFQGSVIFRGVISDLIILGMRRASEVVLVGSSASGVGVLNHAQWVQGLLNTTRIRLIIDSAWFINFEMVLSNMVSNELGQLYNISSTDIPSCLDITRGYPCCLSPVCHLMHSSLPSELPSTLFIFSQYDIYALQFIFDTVEFEFTDVLRLFNTYGSAMITNSNITFHRGNFSFFVPSCAQHRYLVPSEFWSKDGLLTKTADTLITESTFEFYNPLEPGITWQQVFIDGLNLRDAITEWYNNDTAFYYVDSCHGPICNHECPDSVVLVSNTDLWGTGVAVIIFVVAALYTITCVVVKIMLYVCQIYILRKQKKFVEDMTKKEDRGMGLQLENLLPSCTQYCSVSCINLTYRPDVYKSTNKNNKNAVLENTNIKSKSRRKLGRLVRNKTKMTALGDAADEDVIIKDINLYFNPGELVAIMGPSGCGKTTLLDVLTGRRVNGQIEGNIYINGISNDKMKQWFVENTGYVLQLATPFYEELTVRENLIFAINMQLPKSANWNQKLERVEQVIRETGLFQVGDVTVGGPTGVGLSGGEKRRLSIATQLLRMPNILFLDEPTSGLDASSSLSLLKTLHCLAQSGRAIILTIHQPRIEIFHMFDKILLICKGQVAYFGSPFKALNFFITVLNNDTGGKMKACNVTNPADAILDILTKEKSQITVLRAYQSTGEPQLIQTAIKNARVNEARAPTTSISRYPGLFLRLMSLESRASLRQTLVHIIYLPVVYCVFAFILGSVYFETGVPVQIMSVTCLTSCSSSLFMSSIVMWLLIKPLELFRLEHADGIAKAHEVVLQVFVRMSAVCTGPLTVCSTALFLSVYQRYEISVYLIIVLSFLLVNQVWVSLFIFITCSNPNLAHRICPLVAAICGFCCGFIVPKSLMPDYYEWIFYINPSYYAYAATTTAVLNDIEPDCQHDSTIECLQSSGKTTLRAFGLEEVNPILCLLILMIMIIVYITAAILVLNLKLAAPSFKKMLMKCFRRKRRSTKVVALTITANNVIAINPVNNNNNILVGKTSKFLEMEEQEHQVLHYYKPKLYDNPVSQKPPNEDDQQLKKHLSVLSADSICSSEPSLIDMNEDEAERFLRSMQILLNRREMMDEQLGYHPTRYLSQPIIYERAPMIDNVPSAVSLAFDQKSPQRMFAAPNRSIHATDDAQSMTEQNQQPHPLLLQPSNDNNAWGDEQPIMTYSNSPFITQRRHHTASSHHSSIESLEMSEQL